MDSINRRWCTRSLFLRLSARVAAWSELRRSLAPRSLATMDGLPHRVDVLDRHISARKSRIRHGDNGVMMGLPRSFEHAFNHKRDEGFDFARARVLALSAALAADE